MEYENDYIVNVTIECEFRFNCLDMADAITLTDQVMDNIRSSVEGEYGAKIKKVTCNEARRKNECKDYS